MIKNDFFNDLDLFLCEKFGYRECFYVTPTQNGCCVYVSERDVKLYFRMWEYSGGASGFPDLCIIIVDAKFSKNPKRNLKGLVQFFKDYASLYGFTHIGIEGDKNIQKVLNFPHEIPQMFVSNYVAKFEEI